MEDYKKKDAAAILAYLEGKKAVSVDDIVSYSGAEKLRVYPIVIELNLAGRLRVDEVTGDGAPKVVTLIS